MELKNREARAYLRQLEKLDKLIENKINEREYWKALAMNTTANSEGERVKSSSNPQKMADAVCRYVDLEKEIDAAVDVLIDRRREVVACIEQLPAEEYDLLYNVYVQHVPMKEYAYNCGKSYSWALYVHKKGLAALQRLLQEGHEALKKAIEAEIPGKYSE